MAFYRLVIGGIAVTAFPWAQRDGQFDDLETPEEMLEDYSAPRAAGDRHSDDRQR